LHLSFSEHKILALFTQMKTHSLNAAPGNAPFTTLADQIARVRAADDSLDCSRRNRLGCAGTLAEILLQGARAAGISPSSVSKLHYISDDTNNKRIFEERE
jgi:hypothetical protein